MFSYEWVWVIIFLNIAAVLGGGALFLFYRNEKKRLEESGNKEEKRYLEEFYNPKVWLWVVLPGILYGLVVGAGGKFALKMCWLFFYVEGLFGIPITVRQTLANKKIFIANLLVLLFWYFVIAAWLLGYEEMFFLLFLLIYVPAGNYYFFMPSGVAIYNNIVLKSSDKVSSLMNAYMQSVFTYQSNFEGIGNHKPTAKIFLEYAKLLGGNFIIQDWNIFENRGRFEIYSSEFYFSAFRRKIVSYFEIYKDGKICVFVSPGDYRRIREPVTFDELCVKLAETIESSFKAFLTGDFGTAVSQFIGTPHYVPAYKTGEWSKYSLSFKVLGGILFACMFLVGIEPFISRRSETIGKIYQLFTQPDFIILSTLPTLFAIMSYMTTKKRLFTIKEG